MNILWSSFFPPKMMKKELGLWVFTAVHTHKSLWRVTSQEEFSAQDHCGGSSRTWTLSSVLVLEHVRDIFSMRGDYFTLTASYSTSTSPFRVLSLLSRWTTVNSPPLKVPHFEVHSENCSGTQMWKLRV